jgi:hypothetical protein
MGCTVFALAFAPAAMAYLGPGAGLGVLGALLAVLAGIAATIFGLVLLPFRLLRRRRKATAAAKTDDAEAGSGKQS